MNISNNNFTSIQQIQNQLLQNNKPKTQQKEQQNISSFNRILEEKKATVTGSELKFSKHANERLSSRNIDLSGEQIERLEYSYHFHDNPLTTCPYTDSVLLLMLL